MEMRMVSSFAVLLLSLMLADARTMEHSVTDGSVSLAKCGTCLKVSRKAKESLNSPKLFKEAHKLSSDVCHILPGDFGDNCLKKSGEYLNETRTLLQELFQEESLCNVTGICHGKSNSLIDNDLAMETKTLTELEDERSCTGCRRAVRELLNKMRQPRTRTKIVEALLDYCEEAEDDEDQCKEMVHRYGPTVLSKLEKLKSNEICVMMGMCEEGTSM